MTADDLDALLTTTDPEHPLHTLDRAVTTVRRILIPHHA